MPKASSPCSARARAPGTWSSSQAILVRGEIGIDEEAGPAPPRARPMPRRRACGTARAVRRSCQTMALWIGAAARALPEQRGLALVGDADRGYLARADAGFREHAAAHRERRRARSPPDHARPSRGRGSSARAPSAPSRAAGRRHRKASPACSWSPGRSPGRKPSRPSRAASLPRSRGVTPLYRKADHAVVLPRGPWQWVIFPFPLRLPAAWRGKVPPQPPPSRGRRDACRCGA